MANRRSPENFSVEPRSKLQRDGCVAAFPSSATPLLSPLLALVRQSLALPSDASAAVATVRAAVAPLGPDVDAAVPILCTWLGIASPTVAGPSKESAAKQKSVLLDLLNRWFFSSESEASLLVVEDLHWADATTLEFVSRRVADRGGRRGLVLLTARPEFVAPWEGTGVVTQTLAGLDAPAVNDLVRQTHQWPLAPTTLAQVAERTAGVPLFVMEVVRTLAEEDNIELRDQSYHLKRSMNTLSVPLSLRDALAERLDRLGEARETAAWAAALGREFSRRSLAAISARAPSDLDEDLARLSNERVIARLPESTEGPRYVFRHALIRELAYGAMLPSSRELVHGRIADELSAAFPDLVTSDPGLLAPHFAAAGRLARAIELGTRAAQTALDRAANAEAAAHAETVLEWLTSVQESERLEALLNANTILTQALMATRGWANPEVKSRIDFSMKLMDATRGERWHLPARWALMTYHYVAGNRRELQTLTYELAEIAKRSEDAGLLPAARTFVGLVHHGAGRYAEAETALTECERVYSRHAHRDHGSRFGLDSLAWGLATLALVRWFRGNPAGAYAASIEAIAWARELDHVPSLGIALLYAANLHHYAGNRARVAEICEELIALDAQYGYPAYMAYGVLLKSWALGDAETPAIILRQLEGMGCLAALSYYASLGAQTDQDAGRYDAALAKLDIAIAAGARIDEHYYEAELLLLRGTLLRSMGDEESAVETLSRALCVSKLQGTTWTEARVEEALHGESELSRNIMRE